MSFTRHVEDFVCAHCGTHVAGNGYTNHCPNCLWSKHVDIDPGDRKATCGGMMRPSALRTRGDGFVITHRCEVCGFTRDAYAREEDNREALIALSTKVL